MSFKALVDNGTEVEIADKRVTDDGKEILLATNGLAYMAHKSKPLMIFEIPSEKVTELLGEVGDVIEAGSNVVTETGEAADAIAAEAKEAAGEIIDSLREVADVATAEAGQIADAATQVVEEAKDVVEAAEALTEETPAEPEAPEAA